MSVIIVTSVSIHIAIPYQIMLIKVIYGVVHIFMQWIDVAFPCLIPTCAVVSNHGQTSLVSERNKGTAAGGHALRVLTAQGAITSVGISPHITVRLAHQVIKMPQLFLMNLLMLKQRMVPFGMLADGGSHTKLLILVDVHALGTASHI